MTFSFVCKRVEKHVVSQVQQVGSFSEDEVHYTPHFTLLHFRLDILHSALYTAHFTLYTSHSTLYTPRFAVTLHTSRFTLGTPLYAF